MSSLRLALACLVIVVACKEKNAQYCEGHPDDTENCPVDAPTLCTEDTQCPGQVCDTASGACVQCTPDKAAACTDTTPLCGADNTCEACTTHAQCSASNVCLPSGACGDESQIAYVSASGTGTACTKASPCPLLKDALARNLPVVKIAADGAANDTSPVTIDGKAVTILAEPGAKLDRDSDGPILEVKSADADVAIYDLHITGATGVSGGDGILVAANGGTPKLALARVKIDTNQGVGISASGGSLTVTQSTISTNQGGGISVTAGATFDITNNYIFRNGDQDTGTFGGLDLDVTTAGSNRLEFNTIVDNRASSGTSRSGGAICDIAGFTAPNNIIARNSVGGSTTESTAQTMGQCTYPSSKTQNDISGLNFESPQNAPFSYKLMTGSSAIDQATTMSSIAIDHDGDTRPQGAQKDIGADEYTP